MNKPFVTIVSNIATEVQDTSTAMKTIIKEYANARYFQVLRSVNHSMIRGDYTFDTVAGQQEYTLPDDFYKEISVRDNTNGQEFAHVDYQRLITDYPDSIADSGTAARYYIRDDVVRAQPTAASVVSIVSSSASDTSQTVLVRGIVGGVETSESVTLTGTTPVNTTGAFSRVKGISKSANTTGYITLTTNSGAVTLTVLAPKINTSYCKKIGFHYVPSSVVTIALPYIVKPLPMTEDYDYPIIDIADLIEDGGKADAHRYKKQFAKANIFETKFLSGLADYTWDKENQPNQVHQFLPAVYNRDNLY